MSQRLLMTGMRRNYGPTVALDGADLVLEPGTIHALVGENGAGKSTLMKLLVGSERADAGAMLLDGQPYSPRNPAEARRQGVVMVHQESSLAPDLSVEANLLLGQESHAWGLLAGQANRDRAVAALHTMALSPELLPEPVHRLTAAQRQQVEIARALLHEAKILILDEPTSSLDPNDVERLFGHLRRLAARGVSVVYISHFLEELSSIASRYTVLRDGQTVGSGRVENTSHDELIRLMAGRAVDDLYPASKAHLGDVILCLSDFAASPRPTGVSLDLRHGEILGIFGLVGAGRTELLQAIQGLRAISHGSIRVKTFAGPDGIRRRIRQGVGMLSEDRQTEGLALEQSIEENLTASWPEPFSQLGWLNLAKRRKIVNDWVVRLGIKTSDVQQPAGELSGGNQQKVALARLLHQDAEILLLDEPTRGVDVRGKAEIYQWMRKVTAEGRAILLVGSYLPELLGMADRIAVMTRGRLSPASPRSQWTAESLLAAASRQSPRENATP